MRFSITSVLLLLSFALAPCPVVSAQVSGKEGTKQAETTTRGLPDGYTAKDREGNEVTLHGGNGTVEFTGNHTIDHNAKCIRIYGEITSVTNNTGDTLMVYGSGITVTNNATNATVTVVGDNNTIAGKNVGTYTIRGNKNTFNISKPRTSGSTLTLVGTGTVIHGGNISGFNISISGTWFWKPAPRR